MLKKFLFAVVLLGFFTGCSKNNPGGDFPTMPDATVKALDEIVLNEMHDQNLPGVLVGIWVPGEGDYVKAFGSANLETGTHREVTEQFRIASITKTFTGLRILELYDEGKLDLDDSLTKYFPRFPHANTITIRNLLNMNSGIKDYADDEFLYKWYHAPLMPFSMETAMLASAGDSTEFYPAGDSVIYCNVNYSILGLIIEQVTGNTIGEEITENIIKPLGMSHTIYPEDPELPGNVIGYSYNEKTMEFEDKTVLNPEVPNAAGAIISDMFDLKRFARALYKGELISEKTHQEQIKTLQMHDAPEWVRYGLGIMDLGGFYGHNGTIFGFSTEMFYLPEKDAVIIINVNRLDLDDKSKSGPLFGKIAKYLFP
ncbi:MAG: beta-lactamase family protein, partial [Chlorobi bacterium]|nr:beta-lactamase family protein [Chlorobiota bacterium]